MTQPFEMLTMQEEEKQRKHPGKLRKWLFGITTGLAVTFGSAFGQADTIRVTSYDDKGPINGNVELVDEATAERYQQQSTDGVAIFPLGPTSIENVIREDHTVLAPNPIEDHAFFTHPAATRNTPVEAYNTLGQLIGIAQPGDDRLEISTKPGLIIISYYEHGRRSTEKAIVNSNQAVIDIITEDHPAATKGSARLKSTTGTTHTITWKDFHDSDPKLQNHEQETRIVDINDQESGTLTIDLPLQYTYKQNWIGGEIVGATEAVIDQPLSKTVFLPGGALDLQEFKDRYDLREGLQYSVTFTGGPHADNLTINGKFTAADIIMVRDTLVQNYFLEGRTDIGTAIDVRSYPDSTLSLASITANDNDYQASFKWKGLEKEVLITAEKDDERQRYVRTLTPGFTTQDLEFGFPIKVIANDDKGSLNGNVTLLDLGNSELTTKTSQEGITIFKADRNSNTPYTHFVTWRDLNDGNPKLQNHEDEGTGINVNTATGDTLVVELTPQYTAKQNWLGGDVIGALEATIKEPANRNVNMTNGELALEQFQNVYDLRERLPYKVTFTGGPHADDLTINGKFTAADTIMVRDTLTQNYALQGLTSTGASINLFSYPDSTKLLAETTTIGDNYSLAFKKKALNQQALLKAEKDGQDLRYVLNLQPGPNTQNLTFVTQTYDHWFSNTESTPGAHADWYKDGDVIMTAEVDAQGDYITNTWTTTNTTEVADSVVANRQGFNDLKLYYVQVNENNNNLPLDLAAIIHQYRFTGNNTTPNGTTVAVWDNGENIASGTVSSSSYTTSNWQSSLSNMSIDSILFTAPGYDKQKFVNVAVTPGENMLNAQLQETPPITYDYRFRSSNSSPNGTAVAVWDHGSQLATATVNGGSYTTNDWTNTLTSMNIDSITFKLNGYTPKTFTNITVVPGNNTQDANLQETPPQTYDYWLYGNNSSPNGASIKGWRGGSETLSGTVNGDTYQTNTLTRTSTTLTLDSLVMDANGYLKQIEFNFTMNPNGTSREFTLEEEPPITYDYRFRSSNSSPNGTAVAVWEGGNNIATATVNGGSYTTNDWTSQLSSMNIDSITFKFSGYYPETFTNIPVNPGNNTQDANLEQIPPPTYDYRLVSSNSSPNGTVMEAWEDGTRLATATVSGGAYTSNQWTTTLTSMVFDSITFKLTGYYPERYTNINVTPGNNTQDANLEEIPPPTYNYRLVSSNSSPNGTAVAVWEGGNNIATATVNGGSYTTNDWTNTLASMNIDSITFKLNGYVSEKYTNISVVPGNNTQDANLDQITYAYWLENNSSSPSDASISGWKDGSKILSGTVSGSSYETNHINRTSTTLTLDSIVVDAAGHIKEVTLNHTLSPNGTSFGFNLEEEQQGQSYTINGRYISINGSDFISGSNVLKFETDFGTYYATSTGGNFSVNIVADPDSDVAISNNVSGYEPFFISVVGYDSKTGSGPALVDPDDLDNGTIDYIAGRSDIVTNSTWIATQNSPGGFHRGGTLDLEVYDYDEATGGPAGETLTSAQSTALSYVPGACNFGIYGQVVNFSGSPTIIPGAPTSSAGKVLIYSDTGGGGSTNAPNPGMDGTVVISSGTNLSDNFIESMEWLTGDNGETYFFSGTTLTEAGEAKIIYTTKFGY